MTDGDFYALLSGTGVVLVANVMGSSAKLVEYVILGRALSPTTYGDVSVALALLSFCVIVTVAGFTESIPRYVPRFDAMSRQRGVWAMGVAVTGLLVGGTLVAIYLLDALLIEYLFDSEAARPLLWLIALSIPFVVGRRITAAAIRGYGNTLFYEIVEDLAYPVVRIAILLVLLYAGFEARAAGYAYLSAALVAFVLAHVLLSRIVPLIGPVEVRPRELIVFSLPLVVATTSIFLLHVVDTLMLGYFHPAQQVGLYNAAYPLAMGLATVLQSFGILFLPMTSELDAADDRDRIRNLYRVTTKWMFVATFPVFLVFVAFPGDVLTVIFGTEYAGGGTALVVLSVGFFVRVIAGLNNETLTAFGKTKHIMYANNGAFLANLVLNVVLIPEHGILGAAIASAVAFGLLNVSLSGLLWARFDVTPISWPLVRIAGAAFFLLVPAAVLVSELVTLSLGGLLLVSVVATGMTGVVTVASGGLEPADETLVDYFEERVGVKIPYARRYL